MHPHFYNNELSLYCRAAIRLKIQEQKEGSLLRQQNEEKEEKSKNEIPEKEVKTKIKSRRKCKSER